MINLKIFYNALSIAGSVTLLSFFLGCSTTGSNAPDHSGLTHANVMMELKKGITTQQDVLEVFGAPNITTTNSKGGEIWTYQRNGVSAKATESFGTLLLIGGSTSGFEKSSRTMTLIIYFSSEGLVSDYKSRYSSF